MILKKVAERRLCPHCLGRLFAKIGSGLTNKERGVILRNAIDKGIDEGIEKLFETKIDASNEGWDFECMLCQNLFKELEHFSDLVIESLSEFEFDNFLIGCKVDEGIVKREEALWSELKIDTAELIKSEINRELGKLVGARLDKNVEFSNPEVVAVIDTRFNSVEVQVSPLFIYGRYRKLIRGIPQTKWHCKKCWGKGCEHCDFKGKMYETSVEEIIAEHILNASKGEEHFFHGMGREDIDARMLGNGRPFIIEIRRPRIRKLELDELMDEINKKNKGKVEISDLRFSGRDEIVRIKNAKVKKTYRVLIECEKRLNNQKVKEVVCTLSGKTVKQKTPLRVVHRRSDKEREKRVHSIELESLNRKEALLLITGDSGLYIKEFITGDKGRTEPSISQELGMACRVKELDVIMIHDEV